jgi:Predicted metal-dependent phosphoesterases (PHP family)
MKTMDLHMHSCYSDDGEFTPSTLIQMGKEAGLTMMALTDHNSVKGVAEMMQAGKESDIIVIPAIEIDCQHKGVNLHIVGYQIDYHDLRFTEIEETILHFESAIIQEKINLTEQHFQIKFTANDLEILTEKPMLPGETIAKVLLLREDLLSHPFLLPYREGGERSDNPYVNFYWDYYSQGKPCYIHFEAMSAKACIDLIHATGGLAVIAHPGNNLKNHLHYLDELKDLGIDGVEVYSSYHTKEQTQYFFQYAKDNNLYMTLGSDFHGENKPAIHLGAYEGEEEELLKTKKCLLQICNSFK